MLALSVGILNGPEKNRYYDTEFSLPYGRLPRRGRNWFNGLLDLRLCFRADSPFDRGAPSVKPFWR